MKRLHRLLFPAFLVLAIFGVARLRIDTDIINLLPGGNPVTDGLRLYQERFLQAGELLVTLEGTDPEEVERAAQAVSRDLAAAKHLVRTAFWQPPARESLEDSAHFLAYLWVNSPVSAAIGLSNALSPEALAETLAETRDQIQTSLNPSDLVLLPRDPLRLSAIAEDQSDHSPEQFFVSGDGTFRIVYVYAEPELRDYTQCSAWLAEVRPLIHRAVTNQAAQVEFALTGRPVFVEEISSGMRQDMSTAAPGTLLMIALLFFLAHREWRSLGLLVATLGLVMLATLAAGAALLGSVNVISIGFAAILLGLAEDFGVLLHQETRAHPAASITEIRAAAGPPIWWSAVTTASAFGLLNLSALPGLRQLGTLIAVGILLGAWAMLHLFLPAVVRYCRRDAVQTTGATRSGRGYPAKFFLALTPLLLLAAAVALWHAPPRFSPSADVLRPRQSEASATLKKVQATLDSSVEPLWIMVRGKTIEAVRGDLEAMREHFDANIEIAGAESFTLPLNVWPNPADQAANSPTLRALAADFPRIRDAILQAGFTEEAMMLATTVFNEWTRYDGTAVQWPRGRVADWVMPKFVSVSPHDQIALGMLQPGPRFDPTHAVPVELRDRVLVSGWSLLSTQVVAQVKRETPWICAAVGLLVIAALWASFRGFTGVLLSLAVMTVSGLILAGAAGTLGWDWNLINLTALPLLLGMGIDYSIHMQHALRRYDNRMPEVWGVARALALAGSTSIIGFTFLSFSSNLGMASLGRICALGLAILLAVSIFLLPAWVKLVHRR